MAKHLGTKTLETDRLILRKFSLDDVEIAFKNWSSDEKVTKYLRWQTHSSPEETKEFLSSTIDKYSNDNFYIWNITLKDLNSESIGCISALDPNDKIGKIHIGYCLGSKWWGKGIMTEAFKRVIAFLFEEVGINRIESQHAPANPASGKVMQHCGLRYEGTLRESDFCNQGIVDALSYSILAKDYFKS